MRDDRFDELEIYAVKQLGDETVVVERDEDAHWFTLYGLVNGETRGFYIAIGDYPTRADAELTRGYLHK